MFQRILVTGAAGFIGFHLARRLCEAGRDVLGYDSVNDYYDVSLKEARLRQLAAYPNFQFIRADLADRDTLDRAFTDFQPQAVVNLGAQAGVRYSLTNPHSYVHSNLNGFINVLEACRHHAVGHLVYASSSSVYGANKTMPFSVHQNVDHPLSLYAATKKANELMAHTYAHLYGLPCTGLRFFTVYGPWGRPDMALFKFTQAIYEGRPIDVFNHGLMKRDFTYIDDIVEAVARLTDLPALPDPEWDGAAPDPSTSTAPYRLYNIGNNDPVELLAMIALLEQEIGIEARKNFLPMQPGDIPATFADIDALRDAIGFSPSTPLATGIRHFVSWYRDYYRMGNGPQDKISS
jgi:UDP-glucuronate 4-epimerase